MSTPNRTQDKTGITQPLEKILAAIRALPVEQQEAAKAKATAEIAGLTLSARQSITAAVAPTSTSPAAPTSGVSPDTAPLSQEQLLDLTSQQYDDGLAHWRGTFELGNKHLTSLATKDTVIDWVKTLPAQTIAALNQYGGPRLKLLPDMPVENLMRVIDQHKTIPDQIDGKIWWDQWSKVQAPAGSFGLTTDIEDMLPDESIFWTDVTQKDNQHRRTNEQMIAEYKRRFQQIPGGTNIPQYAYLPSAMDAMARGQVYDRQYWTGFDRPQGADYLPYAGWYCDHVFLDRADPDYSRDGLRSRLWVEGRKV